MCGRIGTAAAGAKAERRHFFEMRGSFAKKQKGHNNKIKSRSMRIPSFVSILPQPYRRVKRERDKVEGALLQKNCTQ